MEEERGEAELLVLTGVLQQDLDHTTAHTVLAQLEEVLQHLGEERLQQGGGQRRHQLLEDVGRDSAGHQLETTDVAVQKGSEDMSRKQQTVRDEILEIVASPVELEAP